MEFPLYIGSKKESMPKKLHEVNMHAQYFQEPIPIDKEIPCEKRYQMNKSSHGGYHLKNSSRNEISIDTQKEICQTLKRDNGSKQTKYSTKFHDGTKYQKENGLPSTNTHLIRSAR